MGWQASSARLPDLSGFYGTGWAPAAGYRDQTEEGAAEFYNGSVLCRSPQRLQGLLCNEASSSGSPWLWWCKHQYSSDILNEVFWQAAAHVFQRLLQCLCQTFERQKLHASGVKFLSTRPVSQTTEVHRAEEPLIPFFRQSGAVVMAFPP